MNVKTNPAGGSNLPHVIIEILDTATVFAGTLLLFGAAPTPIDSSNPFDVIPGAPG